MPTFDYKCDCGKTKMNHIVKKYDDVVKCECGKEMKKGIAVPNIGGMDNLGRSK